WSLKNSRELRHAVGEAKTVDDLEQAAAQAAKLREEFMTLYSEARQSYAEECVECEALTGLKEYLEQKRQK
ncbi:unnamed protein product, partial [marine sediment metagenome]